MYVSLLSALSLDLLKTNHEQLSDKKLIAYQLMLASLSLMVARLA